MGMTRAQKEQEVIDLRERFEAGEIIVITQNKGLTVSQVTALRSELRANGATFKVTKNTLARRALEGTRFAQLADLFTGPTGVASSADPVAAAKVAHDFAKKHPKFEIVGGALGEMRLDAAAVEQLAKLPSLDELRSKLIGLVLAPATKIAGVVQAPAGQMARVVGAYAAKGE